ncbi:DivIVA domain-containing protein [Quadrisphaera setariae]|nr:DivIVA domain-containing protein [Quadrisphaera setariae]
MSLVLLLLAVAVVGVVVAVAAGRLPAGMPAATPSSPHRPLPPRPLEPADLDQVRFSVVPRGYRMDQVDAVVDRLRVELAERDRRLEALTAAVSTPLAGGGPRYGAPAPPVSPDPNPAPAQSWALTREEGS